MAVTPSAMTPLGSVLPAFSLPEPRTGATVDSAEWAGRPVLVIFMCNHCPFVVHVLDELVRIGREYTAQGVAVVGVCSNDVATHPDDAPDNMAALAETHGFAFPYLYDETQDVARSFGAACTPDFFLYDAAHRLVYRGELDASRPGNDTPVTGASLRAALDAVLAGKTVPDRQQPSAGCNIKWRP